MGEDSRAVVQVRMTPQSATCASPRAQLALSLLQMETLQRNQLSGGADGRKGRYARSCSQEDVGATKGKLLSDLYTGFSVREYRSFERVLHTCEPWNKT